jgi:hypothetical protein
MRNFGCCWHANLASSRTPMMVWAPIPNFPILISCCKKLECRSLIAKHVAWFSQWSNNHGNCRAHYWWMNHIQSVLRLMLPRLDISVRNQQNGPHRSWIHSADLRNLHKFSGYDRRPSLWPNTLIRWTGKQRSAAFFLKYVNLSVQRAATVEFSQQQWSMNVKLFGKKQKKREVEGVSRRLCCDVHTTGL